MPTITAIHAAVRLESHPAAELFPLLDGAEYEQFRADIAVRGLLEPIWLCDGKILDGRNRYRACVESNVPLRTREFTGKSPVAFVWSMNGARRQLAHGQLAAIAVEMLPALAEEAKKRQGSRTDLNIPAPVQESSTGEAAEQAAKIVGVSAKSVYQAKTVKKHDPEKFSQIANGKIAVRRAYDDVKGKPPIERTDGRQPREKREEQIRALVKEGYRAEQIAAEIDIDVKTVRLIAKRANITLADAAIKQAHRINASRVIEQTVTTIEGCALGIESLGVHFESISSGQAKQWADSMTAPLKTLALLRRKLLEIAA